MDGKVKKIFNIRNVFAFAIFVFLCGGVVGAITGSFLQIMKLIINVLWVKIPQSFASVYIFGVKINFYYALFGAAGGILIGIWQRKYGDYPILLDGIMGIYRRDKNVPYDNLKVVFAAALMPLVFGASVGPEAGLAGIIAMLFCWVRDKYKSGIVCILKNGAEGKNTGLLELIKNPVCTYIGTDIAYGDNTYAISKKKRWAIYLLAAAGGVLAFRLAGMVFAQGGIEIAKFEGFSYTSKEFIWFFPLVIFGILAGLFFLYSKKFFIYVYRPLQNKKILRAVITGLILGLAGRILPYTMFAGEEQMIDVVNNWQTWAVPLLFATGFVKIMLTNCCVYGGWRGGSFFPCLFSATVIGYGLCAYVPADQAFVILVFMAAFTAMSLGQPLIVAVLCMLFSPLAAMVPIILAAFIGGWFNKKCMPKIIKEEKAEEKQEETPEKEAETTVKEYAEI